MSMTNNRRADPGRFSAETALMFTAIGLVVVVVAVTNVAARGGNSLAGNSITLSRNPIAATIEILTGKAPWPQESTIIAAALGAALLVLALSVTMLVLKFRSGRSRVDHASAYLGRGRDIAALSRKEAQAKSARLGVTDSPGVPIGRTLNGGQMLYASFEDVQVDIWGPRTGKTTRRAIPAILEAPGAVLVTSNKRDVVDATRDPRQAAGPVWVFDPQSIALEEPTWWWNPLDYVTDEVKAAKLAEHFASGSRDPGARTDAFFDPAGQDLLAGLLLAAALDQQPITQVYTWLTTPSNDDPVEILNRHGFGMTADQVKGVIRSPEKQRGGVYGTAQQMASCLTNRQVGAWVTPRPGVDLRPRFSAQHFIHDGGTLYSLSKEGKGTAGPLTTALTAAVVEAAEEHAAKSPSGRLAVPLVVVLDEAANVCRWRELPNLYSHYGSRGIVLMTILQSWSQGVDVWGESGMKKLWSAANIKVFGGGVSEAGFLDDLSKLVGDFDQLKSSVSYQQGRRSVSQHNQRERILDVSDLASLPMGRALVVASGSRPTLVEPTPWWKGQHAEAVQASIAAHQPIGPQS
jgi:type IV secretory pathway TraG/TraD family ATPase VirD4